MINLLQHTAEATAILTARTLIGDEKVYDSQRFLSEGALAKMMSRHPNQMTGIAAGKIEAEYGI